MLEVVDPVLVKGVGLTIFGGLRPLPFPVCRLMRPREGPLGVACSAWLLLLFEVAEVAEAVEAAVVADLGDL